MRRTMNPLEFGMLVMKLVRAKRMSQADISQRTGVTLSSVSRCMEKLHDQGFVDVLLVKVTASDGTRRDVKHYRLSKEWGGE